MSQLNSLGGYLWQSPDSSHSSALSWLLACSARRTLGPQNSALHIWVLLQPFTGSIPQTQCSSVTGCIKMDRTSSFSWMCLYVCVVLSQSMTGSYSFAPPEVKTSPRNKSFLSSEMWHLKGQNFDCGEILSFFLLMYPRGWSLIHLRSAPSGFRQLSS